MRKLDQDSITPLYIQLMESIETEIISQRYSPGDRLPSEKELSSMYSVSIITVRRAVSNLIEKGVLSRRQGKGTFVSKPRFKKDIKQVYGFSDVCERLGMVSGGKMLDNKVVTASPSICKSLGLPSESQVVYIRRVRYVNKEPVSIEKNYFPLEYGALLAGSFDDNSLFKFLQKNMGVTVASSERYIEICYATAEEGEVLEVKKGAALLYIRSVAYDEEGHPVYVGRQIYNGDRLSLYVSSGSI